MCNFSNPSLKEKVICLRLLLPTYHSQKASLVVSQCPPVNEQQSQERAEQQYRKNQENSIYLQIKKYITIHCISLGTIYVCVHQHMTTNQGIFKLYILWFYFVSKSIFISKSIISKSIFPFVSFPFLKVNSYLYTINSPF